VALRAGELSEDEAVRRTTARTKALARRQMSWFRRDPRIRWFAAGDDGALAIADDVRAFLAGSPERVEV
jgi:tRNA dimethylallyltransferase